MNTRIGLAFALAALLAASTGASFAAAADSAGLDRAFADLAKFDWGQEPKGQGAIDSALRAAHGDAAARADLEKRLAGILKSEASRAAKDYACRCLARIGTSESVAALAPMLAQEQLSHMARYALERIPGPEAENALIDAMAKADDKLRVGIAASLGARRDASATQALVNALQPAPGEAALAAARALADIAESSPTPEVITNAIFRWREALPAEARPASDAVLVHLASRLVARPEGERMLRILSRDASRPVRIAGLAGLVAKRSEAAGPLLFDALGEGDPALRTAIVRILVRSPEPMPATLIERFAQLPAEGQVCVLNAIAIRPETGPATLSLVRPLLRGENQAVLLAAAEAIGRIGDGSDVSPLARLVADSPAASEAARKALANLPAKDAEAAIVLAIRAAARQPGAEPKIAAELIRTLAARGAKNQCAAIAEYADNANIEIALAAIDTLGAMADEQQAQPLIKHVCSGPLSDSAAAALKSICGRVRDKAAPAILAAWRDADPAAHTRLVPILSALGGADALAAVRQAFGQDSPEVKEAAIRALSEWASSDAAPVLLEIARTGEKPAHRTLALRGYVRLVGASPAPEPEKLKSLREAMALAAGPQDKKLVIGALGEIAATDSLSQVGACLADPQLADEAGAAAVKIVSKMKTPDKKAVGLVLKDVLKSAKAPQVIESAKKEMQRLGI